MSIAKTIFLAHILSDRLVVPTTLLIDLTHRSNSFWPMRFSVLKYRWADVGHRRVTDGAGPFGLQSRGLAQS